LIPAFVDFLFYFFRDISHSPLALSGVSSMVEPCFFPLFFFPFSVMESNLGVTPWSFPELWLVPTRFSLFVSPPSLGASPFYYIAPINHAICFKQMRYVARRPMPPPLFLSFLPPLLWQLRYFPPLNPLPGLSFLTWLFFPFVRYIIARRPKSLAPETLFLCP